MKAGSCRWCGKATDRKCLICAACIIDRDDRNRRVDEGLAAYQPPDKRPKRVLEKKPTRPLTDAQSAHLKRLHAAKRGA